MLGRKIGIICGGVAHDCGAGVKRTLGGKKTQIRREFQREEHKSEGFRYVASQELGRA